MIVTAKERRLFSLFANILDYPYPGLDREVEECEALLAASEPEGTAHLQALRAFLEATSLGRLEEIYTGFFDLNPVCHPYVGYQLFGESYKRSAFLVGLKERYRACGFQADEQELPDRLSVLLRFLAVSEDEELNAELLQEGLLPALDRMVGKGGRQPAPAPAGDVQLEGHSQGEVLGGGFVLEMMAETQSDDSRLHREANPYWQALQALRVALRSLQLGAKPLPGASNPGGGDHA